MIPVSAYIEEFGDMSVGDALNILEEMGLASERVIVYDYMEQKNVVTSIMQYCARIPRNTKAYSIVSIQFCGGPPGNQGWFVGSLKTILIDKVMYGDIMSDRKIKASQQRIVRHIGTGFADVSAELRSPIKIRC
jgi:hypothetical protein